MKNSVYVLGAGFSRGYDDAVFPLVNDFLRLAETNHIYQPDRDHKELARIIATYFNDPYYPNIEKVLSFLSAPSLHYRSAFFEHRAVAYDELVKLIVLVLSEATKEAAASHEIAETYNRFAKHLLSTESTVISFNYDLLLEKILVQNGNWHRSDGYGVKIPTADEAMPTSPHTFLYHRLAGSTRMHWSPVTLLKMHGSISWGTPTIAGSDNRIYQLPTTDDNGSMRDFALTTEYGAPFTLYFKPVIVPPVLDKSSWLQTYTFQVIWNMAMESLRKADNIIFIGYSLPATDFMAEFMFRQAVNSQQKERWLTVVAPDASKALKRRFDEVFGASALMMNIKYEDCGFVEYANERFTEPAD